MLEESEAIAGATAAAVLLIVHGVPVVAWTLVNEGFWFAVGFRVWCKAYRWQGGPKPRREIEDNIRYCIYLQDSINTLWWGSVLLGLLLAFLAHVIEGFWRRLLVNSFIAAAAFVAGNVAFSSKKDWVQEKGELPVDVILSICAIS